MHAIKIAKGENNMKKQLFTTIALAAVSLSLAACKTDKTVSVESVSIDQTSITLSVGGTKQLTATVKPDNATNKAVTWSTNVDAVEVSSTGLVTAKAAGNAIVTVTTLDGGKKAECAVKVEETPVNPKDIYEIDAPVRPADSYVAYKTAVSPTGHDPKTHFVDLNQPYYVGNFNKINLKPVFALYDKDDNEVDQDLWAYDFEFKVEERVMSRQAYEYVAASTDDYSIVDAMKADIKFGASAAGKTYRVTVNPGELTETQKASENYYATYEFEVVDNAFNVYTAKELGYMDTRHGVNDEDYHWNNVSGFLDEWDAFKTANGLTENTDAVSTFIIHKDLVITKNDFPSNVLYTKDDATAEGVDIEGSWKDTTHIYSLTKDTTIIGNYFHLDFSAVPLIKMAEGKKGMVLNSHSSIFRPIGGDFVLKNINVTGNAQKGDKNVDNKYAGGLFLTKSGRHNISTKLYNVVAKQNFTTSMSEENIGENDPYVYFEAKKCNFYDNYNSFFYNQSGGEFNVYDTALRSCGGPIIIQDHNGLSADATHEELKTNESYGFSYYKTYGNIPTSTFDHCAMENYLLGEEAWFSQYEGVQAMVPQIQQLSDLLYLYSGYQVGYLVDENHNPIPSTFAGDKLFNLIAVNKSGTVAGVDPTNILPLSGQIKIVNDAEVEEIFDYARPDKEITTIFQAIDEMNVPTLIALCGKYGIEVDPTSEQSIYQGVMQLGGLAGQMASDRGFEAQMYLHGGLRQSNGSGAPVLQIGHQYGYYNGSQFYDLKVKATTGADKKVNETAYFSEAATSDHVTLYYAGLAIVFGLSKAGA